MPQRHVTLALVQLSTDADKSRNIAQARAQVEQAARQGAQIVCLQELFWGPYPCQSEDHDQFAWAEPIPGPTCELLAETAAQNQVVLVASLFERRAPGLYHNTAVVFDADGKQAGLYRKMHIPDDPGYYEKFYFAPGDLGFPSFNTQCGNVGVNICWDQWFPEAARLTSLAGAEILFFPTAIGWLVDEKADYGESQWSAWETMIRSHAIANGIYVAATNRVGVEGQIEFWGASVVVDPYGNILGRASHDEEEILTVSCDLDLVDTARTHWPFLRDRRVDAYQDLQKRFTK